MVKARGRILAFLLTNISEALKGKDEYPLAFTSAGASKTAQ